MRVNEHRKSQSNATGSLDNGSVHCSTAYIPVGSAADGLKGRFSGATR